MMHGQTQIKKTVWYTIEFVYHFYRKNVLKPVLLVATMVTIARGFAKWKFIFVSKLCEINCLVR